jgi:hypothetical protein
MALALFDRVQETSTTAGTGSIVLAGAVSGFQSFAVVGNGNTCYYTIVDGSAWEVGVGTYSTSGPTLARTTILSNSNGNTSPLTLTANSKSVFLTYPASKSVNLNESGNVSPLGTVVSGIWNGTTIGVAYGGTGVTASSGANSVVLRDSNQNVAVNRVNQANTNTTAAGGTTALTAASSYIHTLVGTGGQTYSLPDATTLTTGVAFVFNNLATGTLTIANYAGTTIGTIPSGGAGAVFLTLNSTVGGTWDLHAYLPEGVTFGTNAFNLGTSIISGGTWQGGTIATGYGGTGLTSYTSGGAVYANSSSTLTSGTLPLTAGGTAATTASGARTSLDVPSTTGSGASGTWGINISGNAATATTATSATTATTATNQSGGTVNATTMTSSGRYTRNTTGGINSPSSRFALTTSQQADYHIASSANGAGPTNTQEYGITFSPSGGSTQAGILISENSGDGTAIGFFCTNSYAAGPQLRASIDPVGNFNTAGAISQNGSQVLTAANYNSYAPTLTGGGASGTWSINITGSAGSAPGYLPLSGGTMTGSLAFAQGANINFGSSTNEAGPWTISVIGSGGATPATKGTGYGRNLIVKAGNSDNGGGLAGGDLYLRAGAPTAPATTYGVVYLSDDGGFTQAGGSLRAPIFYDSNNTAYYGDFASTSQFNEATFAGYIGVGGVAPATNMSGTSGVSIYHANYPSVGFATAAGPNYLIYRLASGGPLTVWNANYGETAYFYQTYTQFYGSARAPIFYDSNDTGYYVDPASTSNLVGLTVANTISGSISGNSATVGGINPVQFFNNMGNVHGTYTNFNSFGDFGFRYMQGGTNGPGTGSSQYYGMTLGLGSEYPASQYATQFYWNRTSTGGNPYVSVRFLEGGSWSSWSKIYAGYADTAGSVSSISATTATGIQTNYVAGINTTTPGQTTYGIAFSGSSSTDNAQGITWGWSGTAAQAGIYVQSSGSYGTKMYFGTTDSFATGSKTSMSIDHNGTIIATRESFRAPIFYDSNNTGYYLDPNSTTALRTVGDWRADSSTWTGEFSGKMQYHSNNWYLQFNSNMIFRRSDGTNVMTCDSGGNVTFTGNVTAYSDARIKENVVTIDSALDKVLRLRGVYYNKIGNPERRVGVIAQETEPVLPEVVRSVSDTNPSTGETTELLAVDYGNITGLLIEATKEQNQEVVDLRNRVAQLESLITKLIGD